MSDRKLSDSETKDESEASSRESSSSPTSALQTISFDEIDVETFLKTQRAALELLKNRAHNLLQDNVEAAAAAPNVEPTIDEQPPSNVEATNVEPTIVEQQLPPNVEATSVESTSVESTIVEQLPPDVKATSVDQLPPNVVQTKVKPARVKPVRGFWLRKAMENYIQRNNINLEGEATMEEILKQIKLPTKQQVLTQGFKDPIKVWKKVYSEVDPAPWLTWNKDILPAEKEKIVKPPDWRPPTPPKVDIGVADYKESFDPEDSLRNHDTQLFDNTKNALLSKEEELTLYQRRWRCVIRTTKTSVLAQENKKQEREKQEKERKFERRQRFHEGEERRDKSRYADRRSVSYHTKYPRDRSWFNHDDREARGRQRSYFLEDKRSYQRVGSATSRSRSTFSPANKRIRSRSRSPKRNDREARKRSYADSPTRHRSRSPIKKRRLDKRHRYDDENERRRYSKEEEESRTRRRGHRYDDEKERRRYSKEEEEEEESRSRRRGSRRFQSPRYQTPPTPRRSPIPPPRPRQYQTPRSQTPPPRPRRFRSPPSPSPRPRRSQTPPPPRTRREYYTLDRSKEERPYIKNKWHPYKYDYDNKYY